MLTRAWAVRPGGVGGRPRPTCRLSWALASSNERPNAGTNVWRPNLGSDHVCDVGCDPMTFGPDIPQVEHEVFARPPLKAMLGQVRFPPILKIADLSSLGGFQETIREDWPQFSQEQQLSVLVGP